MQVVDVHGNTISFLKSLVRYAVFAVPYYLNEISLPVTRTPWIVTSLIAVVIFAVGGATLYLVLFNRHTRQGIHDLAAGSYVADADKMGPLKTQAHLENTLGDSRVTARLTLIGHRNSRQ